MEEIERVIREVSELPDSRHREYSIRVREASVEKYSENAFMYRWRYMLTEILKNNGEEKYF